LEPLVVVVGILALTQDSWPIPLLHGADLHALFGVLLWVAVVARFYRRLRQSPRMLPTDIRAFSRHLSRLVYLLLYVLMFIDLLIGTLRGVLKHTVIGAAEDFQSFLGYGLVALITIHGLAALCRQFVTYESAVSPVVMAQRNGRLT
jgi:cytochrome b561